MQKIKNKSAKIKSLNPLKSLILPLLTLLSLSLPLILHTHLYGITLPSLSSLTSLFSPPSTITYSFPVSSISSPSKTGAHSGRAVSSLLTQDELTALTDSLVSLQQQEDYKYISLNKVSALTSPIQVHISYSNLEWLAEYTDEFITNLLLKYERDLRVQKITLAEIYPVFLDVPIELYVSAPENDELIYYSILNGEIKYRALVEPEEPEGVGLEELIN